MVCLLKLAAAVKVISQTSPEHRIGVSASEGLGPGDRLPIGPEQPP